MTPQTPLCQLTLLAPQALEDALLDVLQTCPELVRGCSVLPAQGLGAGTVLRSAMEQVQGRARRVLVLAVLPPDAVPAVLARLGAALPAPEVRYWVVPVLAQGSLA